MADEFGGCSRDFCVSKTEFAVITSSMALGGLSTGLLAGYVTAMIGRKATLLVSFAPFILGWLLLTFANAPWMLYVGRYLIGCAGGSGSVAVTVYVGEIAQTSIRGQLLSYLMLYLNTGNLLAYILGYFLTMFVQSAISTSIVIVYLIAVFFIPESPRYFVSQSLKTKNPQKEITLTFSSCWDFWFQ